MKKIGSHLLPSALQANPSVRQNLLLFFPDICIDASPLSGGALQGFI